MGQLARLLAFVFAPLAIVSFLLAWKAPAVSMAMSGEDPILEIDSASLTAFLEDSATNVQGVRPSVGSRGVNLDGTARAGSPFGWALAGNGFGGGIGQESVSGVTLATGTYRIADVDMAFPNSGSMSFVIGRTYNARQEDSGNHFDSNGYQGRGWHQMAQPEILLYEDPSDNDDDLLYVIYGADRFAEYARVDADPDSDVFKGTNGAAGLVVFSEGAGSEPDTYVLYDQAGNAITFFGFDVNAAPAEGQFWKQEDPAGNVSFAGDETTGSTAITSGFTGSGEIAAVYDPADRRYSFTYTTINSTDRLTEVKVETKTGGTWASPTGLATVGKVEYEYYLDADSYGDDGDLKLVTITTPLTDSGVEDVRKKYYRYWEGAFNASTNPGHVHAIKYFFDFEGTRNFDWQDQNFDEDFLTASNAALKSHASGYFEYDSSHRVNEAWFNGECGCSGTGNGTHEFEYESNGSYSDGSGYDTAWMERTVVQRPDGSYLTAYHDEAYQALSRVLTDADPDNTSPAPDRWVTRVVRSSAGLVTDIHTPANCTGYTHSSGAITSSTTVGLVTGIVRHGSGNSYEGFVKDRTWREGTSGSAYMSDTGKFSSESWTPAGESTVLYQPHLIERHRYDEDTTTSEGTGSRQTTRSRAYHSGKLARANETTTHPTVSGANLGSGVATLRKNYRDTNGRVTFSRDEVNVVSYMEYTNGQLTKSIRDADTSKSGAGEDFNGVTVPTGYATTSGIHRKVVNTYDAQGRLDTSTSDDGQVTKRYYSKLADGRNVELVYADYEASPLKFYGPVSYSVTNHAGKTVASGTIALSGNSTSSALTAHIDETDDDPITAVDLGAVAALSTSHYSETGGTLEETRSYFSIPTAEPGTDGTHYDPTFFAYDDSGRRWRVKEATGTIRRSVYDAIGRTVSSWIGTNDSTFAGGEPSGTDNMVKVSETVYDSGTDDGNSLVTKSTQFVEDGTTGQRVTEYTHDVKGQVLIEKRPASPHAFHKYDGQGRRVATGLFSSTASIVAGTDDPTTETTNRLALSETVYNEKGQAFKTIRHKIDGTDGSDDDTLESTTVFDKAGRAIKADGSQLAKTFYDGLGRVTHRFILANDDDATYAATADVAGDTVLEERQTTYDSSSSEVLMTATISRFHDDLDNGTAGALDTNADSDELKYTAANLEGRIQITAHWYDRFGRRTDTVRYGTYGDADFDRDGLMVPARSDTALRTSFAYNDEGRQETVTDPRGIVAFTEYDASGRIVRSVRNYDASVNSGNPSGTDDNQTVKYEYTNGLQTKLIADMPSGTSDQETLYTFGTVKGASAGDSAIATGHLLQEVQYPDSAGGSDVVTYAYDAQGARIYIKDQAGNVIEDEFDVAGRLEHRRATTIDADFDDAVERISTTYTDLGRVELVGQYDDATAGSIVDEVKYSYDDWGNIEKFEQDLNSAVGASGSIDNYEVSYTYEKATGGRNTIRRSGVTMPSGNVLSYGYNSTSNALDDDSSRLSKITDGGVRLVDYDYLGAAQVVGTDHSQPDIMWNMYGSTSGSFPDLDRFNRVTSSRWTKDLSTDVDFYDVDIAYDRGSNITLVEDNVHSGFDVSYTMNDLDRLTQAEEGSWSGSAITSKTREQLWTLGHTGNWDVGKLDLNGDGDFVDTDEQNDDRTHNAVNELTGRDIDDDGTDDFTLIYDEVGNLTDDGESYKYEWDVFGRMRKIKNQSDALVAEYTYNGLGFQISEHADTDDDGDVDSNDKWFHSAFDERWRRLATFREDDSDPKEEFVHHQAGFDGHGDSSYINAVVCRDKDANTSWTAASDGVLEQRHYYCQNWRGDVSALITSGGYQVEWAKYSAYGVPFGIPGADTDSDGDCDSADISQIQSWINASSYDIRGDADLDGDVDPTDKAVIQSVYQGASSGRGNLTSLAGNRRGYAGYELSARSTWLARNRQLSFEQGRWMRRDPIGYRDGMSLYQYTRSRPLVMRDELGLTSVTAPGLFGGQVTIPAGLTNRPSVAIGGTIGGFTTPFGTVGGTSKGGCAGDGLNKWKDGKIATDVNDVTICCAAECCEYRVRNGFKGEVLECNEDGTVKKNPSDGENIVVPNICASPGDAEWSESMEWVSKNCKK